MSHESDGARRIREYMENPEGKLAFVLAAEDQSAESPEFILVVSEGDIIAKMSFDEARILCDFLYANLPPRPGVQ